MANKINAKDLERARKHAERREWFRSKTDEIKSFVNNNKETITVLAPCAIGAVVKGVKAADKRAKIKKEEDLKDLYCYDRSLGHYWSLRRKLTNKEWAEIDRRKKCGERLSDILSEMKVLK